VTVAELLHDATHRLAAAGVEDARLEAEVLLAHALRVDRAHVLALLHDPLPDDAHITFDTLIARRLRHEPLAYITGVREFYGVDILCAPGALIPRQETEMLVDLALDELRRRGPGLRIADVGTGGGAIAVAIALNAPQARIIAIERSEAALAVARRNCERYGLTGRVELVRGDLLGPPGVFDVIVANLPYVADADWQALAPEIRHYEPREALAAGPAGTEVTERLLAQAPGHLAPHGLLAAEIGETQAAALLAAAHRSFPHAEAYVMKDLAGRDRVLVVRT
jgi:release factor glutamine methyltransferase